MATSGLRVAWFVGASYGGTQDQTPRFLTQGIWENGYEDRYLDLVKSVRPGDRIAIKSTYTRKHDLPFDNRGHIVSVMAIKAIGTVTENPGDGRLLKVDWTPLAPYKEWYFYTYKRTIWRVVPDNWMAEALIRFTFENEPQDIARFTQQPFWRERFGGLREKQQFEWTRFYQAVADKLLDYKNKRDELVTGIHEIANRMHGLSYLTDKYSDGTSRPLNDICPFTTMAIFNRGITDANRISIANELARLLDIDESVPDSFDGIPLVNNQKSWFFGYSTARQPDDIDKLWNIFEAALHFADSDDENLRSRFIQAYNEATHVVGVGWNLTMGLYWIRPWSYPTLEGQSRNYIIKKLGIQIAVNGPGGRCNADDYLEIMETLEARFREETYPVHSFPELSLSAWLYKDGDTVVKPPGPTENDNDDNADADDDAAYPVAPIESYSLDDILTDGSFLERSQLEKILERLRTKKNLILQGPPGTGKTWLAKRLAFALMGQLNESKLRALQFHPNLSYEDFVRGWRPSGDGKLTLVDGPFLETISAAQKDPGSRYVIVIEEINRGNPAQIFGEMLTLLEADKRTPSEALELSYSRNSDKVYIPDNLYVIGTMNIADRSLALVDYALRRRFAFIDLEPTFGKPWQDYVHDKFGFDLDVLQEIERRIRSLNEEIASDASLGAQFRLGHSYITPAIGTTIQDAREWFRQVVETEIVPLLEEYWFDSLDKAQKAKARLLDGF
ncbi:MAG: AAA family ATPase [Firmicutes bacterium]|nr:AAA family ATPase [Bacillota bacterium]